ncbi:basic salivary proline-rich protein 3-like [Fundulus heteroclitus]|uniref:basic salivary proline-rich protein 3-like n=1 Tax=Fundulus heteroclitus TaxID=8078 RepID=UPI00165A25B9|nr:basic salivary proline-rich protein 3-like [Fundulus heteroclitus]
MRGSTEKAPPPPPTARLPVKGVGRRSREKGREGGGLRTAKGDGPRAGVRARRAGRPDRSALRGMKADESACDSPSRGSMLSETGGLNELGEPTGAPSPHRWPGTGGGDIEPPVPPPEEGGELGTHRCTEDGQGLSRRTALSVTVPRETSNTRPVVKSRRGPDGSRPAGPRALLAEAGEQRQRCLQRVAGTQTRGRARLGARPTGGTGRRGNGGGKEEKTRRPAAQHGRPARPAPPPYGDVQTERREDAEDLTEPSNR